MKLLLIALLAITTVVVAENMYTTKYDNVNLDEVLKSDRLFKNYYNCLIDKGTCTAEGRELKKNVPDALQTECSKCSERQKQAAEKVLRFVLDNKPEEWKTIQAKYDPKMVYYKKYKEMAHEHGYDV